MLSESRITFLYREKSFRGKLVSTDCITADIIYNLRSAKWWTFVGCDRPFNLWKQRRTRLFQVTTSSLSFGSSHPKVFCKKDVLSNFAEFTGKQLCLRPETCNFIKKETLALAFSCTLCKISKNTFSYRIPLVAASDPFLQQH